MVELVDFDLEFDSHADFILVICPELEVLPFDLPLIDFRNALSLVECLEFELRCFQLLDHFCILDVKLALVLVVLLLDRLDGSLFVLDHFLGHRFEICDTAMLKQRLVHFPSPRHQYILVLTHLPKDSVQGIVVAFREDVE